MNDFAEYANYDAMGLAALVKAGEVSPAELLETAIARAEQANPALNAINLPLYDYGRQLIAKGLPEGPFTGVPFLIKDLITNIPGIPTSSGSRFLKDWTTDKESVLYRRYREAGLVTFGKTSLPEFGVAPVTEPLLYGPTRNPWNLDHTPGGSSGGAAAMVAAGVLPVAHAGDGAGSIRIPASCCGLVGLKPSRGRNPIGPILTDSWFGAVAEHVISRTVRDTAAFLDATHGGDPGMPYMTPLPERPFLEEVGRPTGKLKIAFSTKPTISNAKTHPDCIKAVENTARLLEDMGHELVEATPYIDEDEFMDAFMVLLSGSIAGEMKYWQKELGRKASFNDFEPMTWMMAHLAEAYDAGDFAHAIRYLGTQARVFGYFLQDYDLFLTPTLAKPPAKIGEIAPGKFEHLALKAIAKTGATSAFKLGGGLEKMKEPIREYIPFLPLANISGVPSISLPMQWNEKGLPIGVMFTADFACEDVLLRLAAALEKAQPWEARKALV